MRAMLPGLSVWAIAPFAIGVFALFSMLGPVIDLTSGAHDTYAALLRYSVLSGLIAVGYGIGILLRNYALLGSVMAGQLVWFVLETRAQHGAAAVSNAHLATDGILILVQMTVSYTFFLMFINTTARRYLRVQAEIDLAHQIHQVLVPAVDARSGGFEFLGFSRPSGEVGGDLVDIVVNENGTNWFGYVADVSGHGVSSGLVMGMFKSALRMRLRQSGALADLLKDINSVLFPLKTGSMFVTLSSVRWTAGDTLEYAVAGHLPILRVRAGAVDEITTPQIPVAMFETYPFTSSTLDVRPGDILGLITDGLIEVFDRKDREFGLERVKSLLVEHASRPLPEIADRLVSAARAHGRQLDDQTVLLIRRSEVGG
jgi:sigma-B regulation protein RsbU (phosphoserine phosphatase)